MMMGTFDRPPVFPMPDLPRCVVPGAGPVVGRMVDLPPGVRAALMGSVGQPMAEAGGPFNPSDIVRDGTPRSRFLRAYRVRDHWIVWIEQGGIGHGFRMLAFRDGAHGTSLGLPVSHRPGQSLCAASRAIVADRRKSG